MRFSVGCAVGLSSMHARVEDNLTDRAEHAHTCPIGMPLPCAVMAFALARCSHDIPFIGRHSARTRLKDVLPGDLWAGNATQRQVPPGRSPASHESAHEVDGAS